MSEQNIYGSYEVSKFDNKDISAYIPNHLPIEIACNWDIFNKYDRIHNDLYILNQINSQEDYKLTKLTILKILTLKEAVFSSRIEGKRVTLNDLYDYQIHEHQQSNETEYIKDDVKDTSNHFYALFNAIDSHQEGRPISISLIKEIHSLIMKNSKRSEEPNPGAFRVTQNAIGDIIDGIKIPYYFPPPPTRVPELIENLVQYINARNDNLPSIIRIAVVHYQFEAIHPFMDGNGRVGRILVSLLLCAWKIIDSPFIHLGEYFERDSDRYKRALLNVTNTNDFTEWLMYFIEGIGEQVTNVKNLWEKVSLLRKKYIDLLQNEQGIYITNNLITITETLFSWPKFTIENLVNVTEINQTTIYGIVQRLIKKGIVVEDGKFGKSKKYKNPELLSILEAE